jgi:hypothetical protein
VVIRAAIDPDATEGKVREPYLDLHWLQCAGWGGTILALSRRLF